MSNTGIGGKIREQVDFGLSVGLAEVEVLCINPSREQYQELLGIELKEKSKADEYLGESKEGNPTLRVDVWVKNIKSGKKDKIVYFLENKKRVNKGETKKQYINNIGVCSWADDENNLPTWFVKRDYRQAYQGEEEFYSYLRSYLGKLDYKDAETTLQIQWKDLMKGKLDDIRSQIKGAYSTNFVALYTVKTVVVDDETKEYQSIYNKLFLPTFALKKFRLVDYNKEEVQEGLKKKKDLAPHERFVLQVSDSEHGVKDSYYLGDLKPYNAEEFLVASDKPLENDDPQY